MISSLYIRTINDTGFDSVMSQVFSCLGLHQYQNRQSLNYPGGQYIVAMVLGFKVMGCTADDPEFLDYNYWLIIQPNDSSAVEDESSLAGVGELVAKELSKNKFSVAIEIDVGKKNSRRRLFEPT